MFTLPGYQHSTFRSSDIQISFVVKCCAVNRNITFIRTEIITCIVKFSCPVIIDLYTIHANDKQLISMKLEKINRSTKE